MALEAAAYKAYNDGPQQQILEPSVVSCEDLMAGESSALVHADLKLLHADPLASACTCLG